MADRGLLQNDITGNEVWVAGQGPGGPMGNTFLPINMVRNGQGMIFATGSGLGITTQASIIGGTYYWSGAVPASWTVITTANPFDGEIIEIATNTQLAGIVSLVAAAGQSLDSAFTTGTINANASIEYRYQASSTKWFRMR